MSKPTPCLWFDFNADAAVEHYLGICRNGKVLDVTRRRSAMAAMMQMTKLDIAALEAAYDGR